MKTSCTPFEQHEENTDWLSRLHFYRDEIAIFKSRLEEIARKNTGKEVLAQLDHFQNQMQVQLENIDHIRHAVQMNEHAIAEEVRLNPMIVEQRQMEYHEHEADLVLTFEKTFEAFRKELNRFLSKWM
jgi:hypothetical protein